jgi:hypothetical protein
MQPDFALARGQWLLAVHRPWQRIKLSSWSYFLAKFFTVVDAFIRGLFILKTHVQNDRAHQHGDAQHESIQISTTKSLGPKVSTTFR